MDSKSVETKNVKIKGDYSVIITARSPYCKDCCPDCKACCPDCKACCPDCKACCHDCDDASLADVNSSVIFSQDMILEQAVTMALGLKGVLPSDSYVHVVRTEDITNFDKFYVSKFMF